MPGPWEKYGQATESAPPQEEGPWLKYQVPAPQSGTYTGPSSAGADARTAGSMALDFAKKSALPTAGSIAVPAAATALFGPANVPFIPLEQGVGSGLGEAANQALGITEPSLKQIGISTVAPVAVGYGMNALRAAGTLPKTLNTEGPNMAKAQMKGYRGALPASQVMEDATKQGITVPLNNTAEALQEMRAMLANKTPAAQRAFAKVLKDTGLDNLTKSGVGPTQPLTESSMENAWNRAAAFSDFKPSYDVDEMASLPTSITPAKMQGLLEDIGALKANAEDGIEKKYLGKFFSALNKDLDSVGAELGPARDYWKREQVITDIEKAIDNAVFTPKGQGLQTQFNANKIINELNHKSEGLGLWFSQSFNLAEQGEIKNLLGFLNELPSLKPGAGQQFGSGRFWQRGAHVGAGASIGGAAGFSIAGPAGAAVGAAGGAMVPEAYEIGKLAMQAWRMPGGREVVKRLFLNSDAASVPYIASTLTAFLGSGLAKNVQPVQSGTMLQPFGNEK